MKNLRRWGLGLLFTLLVTLFVGNAIHAQIQATILDIAWSPDGTRIAQVTSDGTVEVFNAASGQSVFSFSGGVSLDFAAVVWNSDSSQVAAGLERYVYVWDINSGQNLLTLLAGAANGIAYTEAGQRPEAIRALDWHWGSDRLVSVSLDGFLRIWDTLTGSLLTESTITRFC